MKLAVFAGSLTEAGPRSRFELTPSPVGLGLFGGIAAHAPHRCRSAVAVKRRNQ